MTSTDIQAKGKNNMLPIIMMFALFFMIAFVTGLPSPMGVIVAKQFSATNFESQLGFFANFIAYAFMGLPAGLMIKRIGYKKTALAALIVGLTGVFVQFLSGAVGSFAVYLTGAFISGFSMCMLNTVANPMINTLGGGGKKGNQLIQIGGSFNSLAATITPMLVGYLMGAEAGRTIEKANPALFLAMGIFALAFIVLWFVDIPEPHIEKKDSNQPRTKDSHSPFSFRHFIFGIIAIFFYVGIEVGIPSVANLYMTNKTMDGAKTTMAEYERQQSDAAYLAELKAEDEANAMNDKYVPKVISKDSFDKASEIVSGNAPEGLGIAAGIAGFLVGIYWLLMLVGRLIGSSLGAKFSSRAMLGFVSGMALLFIIAAIFIPSSISVDISSIAGETAFVPLSIILIILCGIFTSIMWGAIFNLSVEGLGKYTATASGIFMVMVCGGGILPMIQGLFADITNYINSYWIIVIALAYILFYAIAGYKNVNTDIKTE